MRGIATWLALAMALIIVLGFTTIVKEGFNPADLVDPTTVRLHWSTGNTTRIWGEDAADLALQLSRLQYSAYRQEGRPQVAVVINPAVGWEKAALVTPLFADPLRVVLLLALEGEGAKRATEELQRLQPMGLPALGGVQVLTLGISTQQAEELRPGFSLASIPQDNISAWVAEARSTVTGHSSRAVLVASAEKAGLLAPALGWVAHSGDALVTVQDGELTEPSVQLLHGLQGQAPLYLVGSETWIPGSASDKFSNPAARITGMSPVGLSIAVAEWYDPKTLEGWWATGATPDGWHNSILVNGDDEWGIILASQLAVRGKFGPILVTEAKRLPAKLENYLWRMKPAFYETPSEGPWNHTWVVGNLSDISYAVQSRVDFIHEIEPYEQLGPQALSGIEALSLVWIALCLASALYILIHLFLRNVMVSWPMRIAWPLAGLVLGPVGLWGYIVSYLGYYPIPMPQNPQKSMWKRPMWLQALVATFASLATAMSAMIATGFLIMVSGAPQFIMGGPLYVLGNFRVLIIAAVYALAVLINTFIYMPAMLMEQKDQSYGSAVATSFPLVLISMTTATVGMMVPMWWLQMEWLPLGPEEDELIWWGTALLSAITGFATAYVANWFLVEHGRKKGSM